MFENLTERLNSIFAGLTRRGKLSEDDVNAAMREVRIALLEASGFIRGGRALFGCQNFCGLG